MTEFVKIKDPNKRGDYLVLAKGEFDPKKHELFEDVDEDGGEANIPKPTRRGKR